MKFKAILLVLLLFMTACCHKEEDTKFQKDKDGVIISLPYQWKKSLHNNLGFHSNSRFKFPVYYNGNIAIPTTNGDNVRQMSLINPDNGETLWSWDDRYQPETERIMLTYAHQYNNLLTYQEGDRSYCINLDNGSTHWKFRRDKPYDIRIMPYKDNYYFTFG